MNDIEIQDGPELFDITEACRFLGGAESPLNRATFYRGIKLGTYPRPVKIGGLSRWLKAELADVVRRAVEERDNEAAA